MKVLAPGDEVTIDYTNAPRVWFNMETGKIITDTEEIAKLEEIERPIREKALRMYSDWLNQKR